MLSSLCCRIHKTRKQSPRKLFSEVENAKLFPERTVNRNGIVTRHLINRNLSSEYNNSLSNCILLSFLTIQCTVMSAMYATCSCFLHWITCQTPDSYGVLPAFSGIQLTKLGFSWNNWYLGAWEDVSLFI